MKIVKNHQKEGVKNIKKHESKKTLPLKVIKIYGQSSQNRGREISCFLRFFLP